MSLTRKTWSYPSPCSAIQKLLTAKIAKVAEGYLRILCARRDLAEKCSYDAAVSAGAAAAGNPRILPTRADTCAPFERQ